MDMGLGSVIRRKLFQITKNYSIGSIGSILLGIPAACLSLVLLSITNVKQEEQDISDRINRIEQRITTSQLILRYAIEQETSVRGYLLTQDQHFLQPYSEIENHLNVQLVTLQQQTSAQDVTVKRLSQQIQQQIQQLKAILVLGRLLGSRSNTSLFKNSYNGLPESEFAQLEILLQKAQQTTNEIHETVDLFLRQQQKLSHQQTSLLNDSRRFTDLVQVSGALLSVFSYITIVILFRMIDRRMSLRDREIRETQEVIQTLTTQLVDGVIMVDQEGLIESMNPAAERILGHPISAVVGCSLFDVLFTQKDNSNSAQESVSAIERISRAEQWIQEKAKKGEIEQLQAQQASGELIPIELSVSHSASSSSDLIVLLRDVSERMHLTNALKEKVIELGELNQQLFRINIILQRKNQSLETFVKAAAHDLKTPIRGIASLSQWLSTDLEESLTSETRTFLRLINQRVLRMQAIADGLLSYASIDAWVERWATINIRTLLEEVCQAISIPDHFKVTIQGDMPVIRTPYLALKLVFEQLIRNAVDHHDRGTGSIDIIGTVRKPWIEFIVRDDGPGIAPAYRDRVLQIFQVLKDNPDDAENIGVGLALVHKAIQLMGGTLDLKSVSNPHLESNRGLEVYFTWPLASEEVTNP